MSAQPLSANARAALGTGAALELRGIRKTFLAGTAGEVVALSGIDLELAPGDFVTVIGSNGAGKSTLARAILGAVVPDQGTIRLDGREITRDPVWRRAAAIGRIAQDPNESTCAGMTIEENLAMAERRGRLRTLARAVTSASRRRYVEALAPLGLGIESRLGARVGTLSGGQRQALALLMATISGSRVLLLDEHLAALDPKTAEIVMTLTARLAEERGLTTIMITHKMQDAIRWGDRLVMMDAGRILFEARDEAKAALTVAALVERFHVLGAAGFSEDRVLLAGGTG